VNSSLVIIYSISVFPVLKNQVIQMERNLFNPGDELTRNYHELKTKLDAAIENAGNSPDLREAKGFLIEVQNRFKGLKLQKEDREELYGRLQDAFAEINLKIEADHRNFEDEALHNYTLLKEQVDQAVCLATHPDDFRETWSRLVDVQSRFKGMKLKQEHREELYSRLQGAFDRMKDIQQKERAVLEKEAGQNYTHLKEQAETVLNLSMDTGDADSRTGTVPGFSGIRNRLKEVQAEIRDSRLLKEQREELYGILQQAFEMLNLRQDEEREKFEKQSNLNYDRLKDLVAKGLRQAEETSEYKETREFLKKIQAEFKGAKMTRDQREELYSRLQTAFEILSKRLDEYFHLKKKNWSVKMQYKVSEYSAGIFELQESLEQDRISLDELKDQQEILESSGKGSAAGIGLRARISALKINISNKEKEIVRLESEMEELKGRLDY
jgi:hypothetical protein